MKAKRTEPEAGTPKPKKLASALEAAARTEVRIVAGDLRGRKVNCRVTPDLRPTPQMVREAFFSILGNAIPGRPFVDVFAGTGVVGMEAISRRAKSASFIERDFALANVLQDHLKKFGIVAKSKLFRTDCYRWIASYQPPDEPINIFVSPPFVDLHERPEVLVQAVKQLQEKVAVESVIVLQIERDSPFEESSAMADWERRTYSRNVLLIWQKEVPDAGMTKHE